MTLHRWTPRELAIAIRQQGRLLDLVPKSAIQVKAVGPALVELTWPKGPRGHAIVGICPELCHFVVEYPRPWRARGREIGRAILAPSTPIDLDPKDILA